MKKYSNKRMQRFQIMRGYSRSKFHNLLKLIQQNFSEEFIEKELEISPKEFSELRYKLSPSIYDLMKITYHGKFDVCAYFEDLINDEWILKHLKKEPLIDKQFLVGAFTKNRVPLNIINYLDLHMGSSFTDTVLSRTAANRYFFEDQDKLISTRYMSRLHKELSNFSGQGAEFLTTIGKNIAFYDNDQIFQKSFNGRTFRQAYEYLLDEVMPVLEHNFNYKILSLSSNELKIEHSLKEELQDLYGVKNYTGEETDSYKAGFGLTPGLITTKNFGESKIIKSLGQSGDTGILSFKF